MPCRGMQKLDLLLALVSRGNVTQANVQMCKCANVRVATTLSRGMRITHQYKRCLNIVGYRYCACILFYPDFTTQNNQNIQLVVTVETVG